MIPPAWMGWGADVGIGPALLFCLLLAVPLALALPAWSRRLLRELDSDPGSWAHDPKGWGLWWAGSLLLAALCGWRLGAGPLAWAAVAYVQGLWALSWVDARTGLLPDGLTLPLLWLGLLVNLDGLFAPLRDAVLGAALGYGALWLLAHLYAGLRGRQGMGGGDFKLLGALGAWLGWQALPMVLLVASVGGLIWALGLALRGRLVAGQTLVFGPWLALAGAWALLG